MFFAQKNVRKTAYLKVGAILLNSPRKNTKKGGIHDSKRRHV
jgi:hypothetical protein